MWRGLVSASSPADYGSRCVITRHLAGPVDNADVVQIGRRAWYDRLESFCR